ncbi:MAG: hypothetical protein Terrestrivirus2_160 [Terrestrivirus sp.]|jgi:hypothetical protein|uniref:Uncharacterized protein n=1 Tax=Terrestrivirus sp. TaxID=2487775 RepID=A0A3G4ZLD0_9VIRU|nr:MAG: hypothetical protein Terrestrivirus2_160 [Terrestrivirus sp.]
MHTVNRIMICLIVVIIIICLFWAASESSTCPSKNNVEGFYNYCTDCKWKALGQCMKCANCGFISKNGYGKCVAGDTYGPYDFDPEYVGGRWIYNDPYWSHILVSADSAIPTTHVYNDFRYPYYRKWSSKYPKKNGLGSTVYPKKLKYMKNTKTENYDLGRGINIDTVKKQNDDIGKTVIYNDSGLNKKYKPMN